MRHKDERCCWKVIAAPPPFLLDIQETLTSQSCGLITFPSLNLKVVVFWETSQWIYSSVLDAGQLSCTATATESKLQEEDPTESGICARYEREDQGITPSLWCLFLDTPLLWTKVKALLGEQFVPIHCRAMGRWSAFTISATDEPALSFMMHHFSVSSEGKRIFSCSSHA